MAGPHRARQHGSSLEFDDYRPYQPGDDPRRVDRNAHQRLGRLMVKLYEAEEDTGLQVVLDVSASMGFGRKARLAAQLAASLGVIALHGGDRVRMITAGSAGRDLQPAVTVGPWQRGRRATAPLLHQLQGLDAQPDARRDGRDGDLLVEAIRRALPVSRRGPLVVISDLLTPSFGDVLRGAGSARAGAVCLQVLGVADLDPPLEDDPRLVDADFGTELDGAATPAARRRFTARRDAWLAEVTATAGTAGVALRRLTDDADDTARTTALLTSGVVG